MGRPKKIFVRDTQQEEEYSVEKIIDRRLVDLSSLRVHF